MQNIKYAVKQSIPVMLGYIFLGIAFGLMLQNAGYHFVWAFLISLFVYAGSMQFLLVNLLSGGAGLLYCAMMTLFINGRHIFYGLSFIHKYHNMGKAYPYMIFSLTDETYSLLCSLKIPRELDEKKTFFLISLLNQCYWIAGSVIGAAAGQLISFDSTGIDFSMTALFTAIVVEQLEGVDARLPVYLGFISSLLFLILLGPDRFILPSLALTVVLLLAMRSKMSMENNYSKEGGEA